MRCGRKERVVAPSTSRRSRARRRGVTALVKKLPAEAGPIEAPKKAPTTLPDDLERDQQDQDALLKTSEEHNLVGILATLLKDAEEAEREAEQAGEATEDADVSAIKVGRKTLGMDYVATKLYVLTLYVNLCFIGGAEQLRNPPTGMELLFDTVLETADESGESGDTLIYYATAGLHNCCLHKSFAECANSKKNAYQRFTELKARCELCPQKEEHGQSPAAQTAPTLRRLDVGGPLPHALATVQQAEPVAARRPARQRVQAEAGARVSFRRPSPQRRDRVSE